MIPDCVGGTEDNPGINVVSGTANVNLKTNPSGAKEVFSSPQLFGLSKSPHDPSRNFQSRNHLGGSKYLSISGESFKPQEI